LVASAALPQTAQAARHALLVGVGDYDQKKSGLVPLNAPAFDAEAIANILSRRGVGFEVTVLTDEAAKDKPTFSAALEKFLSRIRPGDEVVFYFSGHGVGLGEKGNYYLLLDNKDQDTFIREERKKPGSARDLDTQEKENQRYAQYMAESALSELEIEQAIKAKGADVIIIIADACRSPVSGAKGLVPANSVKLPAEPTKGTFRLYATRRGQISFDSPENSLPPTRGKFSSAQKTDKKERKPVNSLFTSVLLSQLTIPRQEINVLFSNVKIEVRDRARSLYSKDQVPDFDDSLTSRFYFWVGQDARDVAALCSTADGELERLRRGVSAGSVFADEIERARNRLAVCSTDAKDYVAEINSILRLQEQGGGGALSSTEQGQQQVVDANDPFQQCDALASSQLDQSRPPGIRGVDLQAVAIDGRASSEARLPAIDKITRAIKACETAVKERGRVARFKFNLGSAHYAMATLSDRLADKTQSLVEATRHLQDAVDLGYPAAYNGLALMHQNGEYHDPALGKQMPRNLAKARDLLQRGADLGHVLALYHLGLAYKNGGLGLNDDLESEGVTVEKRGTGKAFQYLSKAAESGFLPAMIETALALKGDWGAVEPNPQRAIELLEIAASRGSWEAMYQLGVLYDQGEAASDSLQQVRDPSDAIIWYARAAEAGHTRSQARLAAMLTEGEGLPAPQRDAAGRYWRLAAGGGSMDTQMRLAQLLQEGKLPFRPKMQGKPDGGAEEIQDLYLSAFARGNPTAGYELGRLYRTGFPKDRPSDVIPKKPDTAVELLWDTMDRVRQARPTSPESDPMVEVFSAFELISMYDAGEAKRSDGSDLLNDDQVAQLREYGERSTLKYMNFRDAVLLAKTGVTITCRGGASAQTIAVWSWKRPLPPTDPQFEWFERVYNCREQDPKAEKRRDKDKQAAAPEKQGLKRVREYYKKQYEAWVKERDAADKKSKEGKGEAKEKPRSFTDKIAELLDDGGGKRRR
jgi:TPR repeat protein